MTSNPPSAKDVFYTVRTDCLSAGLSWYNGTNVAVIYAEPTDCVSDPNNPFKVNWSAKGSDELEELLADLQKTFGEGWKITMVATDPKNNVNQQIMIIPLSGTTGDPVPIAIPVLHGFAQHYEREGIDVLRRMVEQFDRGTLKPEEWVYRVDSPKSTEAATLVATTPDEAPSSEDPANFTGLTEFSAGLDRGDPKVTPRSWVATTGTPDETTATAALETRTHAAHASRGPVAAQKIPVSRPA